MSEADLVLIPSPGRGHLQAALQLATLLVDTDHRLSVTVLIINPYSSSESHRESPANNSRIRFIHVAPSDFSPSPEMAATPIFFIQSFISSHRDNVKKEVKKLLEISGKLAGFVVDMFCNSMIDVAHEFAVPAYVFFPSGASILGITFYLQELVDDQKQDPTEFKNSPETISIPSYKNPFPAKLLPSVTFDKQGGPIFCRLAADYRRAKGVLINTFLELECHGIKSLSDEEKFPLIYPIGPLIHFENNDQNPKFAQIMNWLDEQPQSSVVFLCFGSMGWFDKDQVKEIAAGLEQSGKRFLWSLRKPPLPGINNSPGDYENFEEILTEEFLRRTAGIGKVVGWAPQVAILSHPAVGGFVSHCGWNSILESLWFGVPIATWPMFAEQQANAFELVKDLGLASEIKMDYEKNVFGDGVSVIVSADDIEAGIRRLMDAGSPFRAKVEVIKGQSRAARLDGGSSYVYIRKFVEDVMNNVY